MCWGFDCCASRWFSRCRRARRQPGNDNLKDVSGYWVNDLCSWKMSQLFNEPFDKSSDVTFPFSWISLAKLSALRVSQNLIFLSKCPLMIVDPDPSVVTRSLQLDPANFVSMQALLRRSHTLSVRSWLPVTIFCDSPTNFAAITLPLFERNKKNLMHHNMDNNLSAYLWPVSVCCK